MKTTKQIIFASLFASLCSGNYAGTKEKEQLGELNEKLTQNSISFTENKGQIVDQNYIARPDVYFGGQSKGLTFHLRNNGISYQLNRVDTYKEVINKRTGEKSKTADQQTIYRIDINWLNANTRSSILKEQVIDGESNYYTAGCPDNGALHVRSYKAVTYQNLYTGIDLKWYEKNGELKYDYLCAAGSDYHQIQLQIKGAEELKINSKGELEIKTPLGTIVEKAPLVLQDEKPLKSNWVLIKNADGTENLSFNIQNLNSALPYLIDPVVRLWGTYYGGSGDDFDNSCFTDASGNVYMSGYTISNTNIATAGAHQTTFGGNNDAYLVKFNSTGVRQWGTYYGGSGSDSGYSCSTDASGNIYLSGFTGSSTNIATAGAHQPTFGGIGDAYLVKFNSAGIRQWGTYYGGSGNDSGISSSTAAFGNVYMSGFTNSNTNIATAGAHQATFGGGTNDAFLVKFSDCVAINPIATVNATVCAGAALNFTASISGTITPTYSWSGPNSFTSNIQNPSITNAVTVNIGVYTLTVNNGGCVETTTTQVSSVSACTGINQLVSNSSDYNFLVYPNPSKGVFNIECKDTDPNSLKVIEVADALGRILISEKIYTTAYELNLTSYVNGIYFIKVIEDGKVKTVKVVRE